MWVLPDVVGADPEIVFCGMAGAQSTRSREHHYDSPTTSFWECLHLSGLTPRLLAAHEEGELPAYGLGLTDLVHHREPEESYELDALVARVERWAPTWLALTGKQLAAVVARGLGSRAPRLGVADLYVGPAQVFVLPGPSGANRRHDYDGRPTRLAWWRDLAALVDSPWAGAP